MRILVWGNCHPLIGGIETFVNALAQGYADRGHPVAVISDGRTRSKIVHPGYTVHAIPQVRAVQAQDAEAILGSVQAARSVIEEFRPDVIHYQASAVEGMIMTMACKSLATPVVTTFHNAAYDDNFGRLFAAILNRSRQLTAVSGYVRQCVEDAVGHLDCSVAVIENAVPMDYSVTTYAPNGKILALGRLVPEKGFDTLIDAFALVARQNSSAQLTLFGQGLEFEPLQDRIKSLGLQDRAVMPGWLAPEEVHDRMGEAAMVAFPSRWQEPFGLVALEAARAARPCIGTAVGGLQDIIVDGETGWLVPPDNPALMAEALQATLADPQNAERMGVAARARALESYCFDGMVDEYLACLARVIENP